MYRTETGAAGKRRTADGNSPSEFLDASGHILPEIQRQRCEAAATRAKEFLLNAPQKIDTERLT
ncbi:MAG: hypothetical protein LBS70_06290, partial [Candidatus Accumulibacter sp.]|nr:hypothetical protein [Accumulibacter sp.]